MKVAARVTLPLLLFNNRSLFNLLLLNFFNHNLGSGLFFFFFLCHVIMLLIFSYPFPP